MYQGDIYIDLDDLMKLMGTISLQYARKKHRALRREAGKKETCLTIGDYCKITGDDYAEIYGFLRGKAPPWVG